MTREKAIEEIIGMANALQLIPNTPKGKAVALAIKALEQEPTEDATLKDIFCMGCEYKEQEPCEDAISREQILAIASDSVLDLDDYEDCEDFLSQIRELPSVTPRTGTWERRVVEDDSPLFRVRFYCSSCGEWNSYGESEYCPNCGARMVEPQESEVNNG